jgi:hypothetical protein
LASRPGWRTLLVPLLLAFLLGGCDDVSHVERIVLVNPTDYDVLVDVKGADETAWLGLGVAKRDSETLVQQVIDQGETWVFRFSYVREELGEDRVSRSDLVRNRWRYEIPERLGEILKQKGYAPSVG